MPNNIANTSLWFEADVYVAASLATADPADASAAFGAGWTQIGLLEGADGFAHSRNSDTTKFYGWGDVLAKISRRKHESMVKFTVLEDNASTRALIWPGSTYPNLVVPAPANIKMAFETRDSAGKVVRYITANYAQVDVDGDITMAEDDLSKVTLVASIFPTDAKVIWKYLDKPSISSIAITALTLALSLSGAVIKKLVATATYSDSSTGDVSDSVAWTSSVPAKATVATGGFVTGLTTGATNVSCTLGGVTSTAPSVVTVSS